TGYTYNLLPSFIGLSESQARALASKYGISVSFTGGNGFVISQSQPANRRLDLMGRSVTLTLGGNKKDDDEDKEKEKETDKDKKTDDEEDDDSGNTSGGSSGGNTSGGSEGGNTSGGSEGGNTSGNDDQGSSETSQQNP
ncbi:MAG: PASTA domain-containing protein, partial [Bacilli bacterium]|nr:PASTA domain-containing protein [Bacilli bacterium]